MQRTSLKSLALKKQKSPETIQRNISSKKREHWHYLLDSTVWNKNIFREDGFVINAYSKPETSGVQQTPEHDQASPEDEGRDSALFSCEQTVVRISAASHLTRVVGHTKN